MAASDKYAWIALNDLNFSILTVTWKISIKFWNFQVCQRTRFLIIN